MRRTNSGLSTSMAEKTTTRARKKTSEDSSQARAEKPARRTPAKKPLASESAGTNFEYQTGEYAGTATGGLRDSITVEQVGQRAWEIWQSEGCPEGRALEHWLQAEQDIRDTKAD